MARAGTIKDVRPKYAIPGGEIAVECVAFEAAYDAGHSLLVDDKPCRLNSASSNRLLANIPEEFEGGYAQLSLEVDDAKSELFPVVIGKRLIDGMHIVANPAIDPADDALVLTRSGSRGQH